eukprot:symbB.v1.2.018644.t1/scaffold1450.1/size158887/4
MMSQSWWLLMQCVFSLWRCVVSSHRAIKASQERLLSFEATAGRTCVRYAVLANAGLACASICQGRFLRRWFWKAWRLSLKCSKKPGMGLHHVDALHRVLQRSYGFQDGHQIATFQAWARSVSASHCLREMQYHGDILGRYQRLSLATETVTTALKDEKDSLLCLLVLRMWNAMGINLYLLRSQVFSMLCSLVAPAYFTWQIRRELQQVHCELQEQRLQRQKLQEELDRLKAQRHTSAAGVQKAPVRFSAESPKVSDIEETTRLQKLRQDEARLQQEFLQLQLQRDELQKLQQELHEIRRNTAAKPLQTKEEVEKVEVKPEPSRPRVLEGPSEPYGDKLRAVKLNELTLQLLSAKAQLDEDTTQNSQRWILHIDLLDKIFRKGSWFCGIVSLILRSWSKRSKLLSKGPVGQRSKVRSYWLAWQKMHFAKQHQRLRLKDFAKRQSKQTVAAVFFTWRKDRAEEVCSLPCVAQTQTEDIFTYPDYKEVDARRTPHQHEKEVSTDVKVVQTETVIFGQMHPSGGDKLVQTESILDTPEKVSCEEKVVQTDRVSAGKLPLPRDIKFVQTESLALSDTEEHPSTDVKLVQTDSVLPRRLPLSTDAKNVQTESVGDREQQVSTDVKVVQTETVIFGQMRPSCGDKLVQTESMLDTPEKVSCEEKVVQTDRVSAGKLPLPRDIKFVQTESFALSDTQEHPSTDVKLVQTDSVLPRRLPLSTDAKNVQTEAVGDREQQVSTEVKVVQTEAVISRISPVDSQQYTCDSRAAKPETEMLAVSSSSKVVEKAEQLSKLSAPQIPVVEMDLHQNCSSQTVGAMGATPEFHGVEDELVSTSEMRFVQCLAGKVEAARLKQAQLKAPRGDGDGRSPSAPSYAIDLEAQAIRPLPPKVPTTRAGPKSGTARLHSKLRRQAESARSRIPQSDITLRQLMNAAAPRSPQPSPRRCPYHGSGAAAITGVAPLYYEGPDCEFTMSALMIKDGQKEAAMMMTIKKMVEIPEDTTSRRRAEEQRLRLQLDQLTLQANQRIEKSNEEILRLNAQLKEMMENEDPDLEQERQDILATLQERRRHADELQRRSESA